MKAAVQELSEHVPVATACAAFDFPRSSFYRVEQPAKVSEPAPRQPHPRSLSQTERAEVLALLHSERFRDSSPRQVWATLLDEGVYFCSIRTMYRLLEEEGQSQERRNQRTHPAYARPELLAVRPNQLWSWDITRLRGPRPLVYFYLYVVLDVFSRYVVGWMVAERESAKLATHLVDESCAKQGITQGQLTLHSDRGAPMTAKDMVQLLDTLGVTQSHSRPYTSNDNPYSEAQFKTAKYRPDYPDRFPNVQAGRAWAGPFMDWYNNDHRHSSLGLMTPAMVHYGQAEAVIEQRRHILRAAYQRNQERFVNGLPQPPRLPTEVWINPPLGNPGSDEEVA